MRFDTYELYYLDTYDQEAADLIEDFGYDEDDVACELDSEYVIDNGVRVCVSQMNREEQYDLLDRRLRDFAQDYARK